MDIYIIIPIYNVKNYVRRCVESVLNQTHRHTKIILIDDGSTDSSGEIIEDYRNIANVDITHKPNGGLSSARNAGIERAFAMGMKDSDMVVFLDSDDFMSDTYIESILKALQNHANAYDVESDLALGGIWTISQDRRLLQKYSFENAKYSGIEYLSSIEGDYFSFSWGGYKGKTAKRCAICERYHQ